MCVGRCWARIEQREKLVYKRSPTKSLASPTERSRADQSITIILLCSEMEAEVICAWEIAEGCLQMTHPAEQAESPSLKSNLCSASPCFITLT